MKSALNWRARLQSGTWSEGERDVLADTKAVGRIHE